MIRAYFFSLKDWRLRRIALDMDRILTAWWNVISAWWRVFLDTESATFGDALQIGIALALLIWIVSAVIKGWS